MVLSSCKLKIFIWMIWADNHSKGLKVAKAEWVNILEEPLPVAETCEADHDDNGASVKLSFRCFEIKTLKLDLA